MRDSQARTIALWIIVLVFAAFTVVTTLSPDILPPGAIGVVNTILLVAFALVHGIAAYGGGGIALFIVICLVVSNAAENLSIVTGFPFGHYSYTDVLGVKLFLVPVTIGGAYFGAGYLAWTVGRVLLGRFDRVLDGFARWSLPLVAAFLMASWDFMLDPGASTINRYWIWKNGGGYFGVPFENYVGWLLTVFVFYVIFAWLVAGRGAPQPNGATAQRNGGAARSKAFWAQAILMYALLGVRYALTYFVPSQNSPFTDAVGHVWMRHDIYGTTALAAIFTVFAFSILAALRLADPFALRPGE